jgi:hypothetical protein
MRLLAMACLPGMVACARIPAAAPAGAADSGDVLCRATAQRLSADPRVAAMVAEAERQHAAFGGQSIDARGTLTHAGFHEAEWDRAPGDPVPAWRKVQAFWDALGDHQPPSLRGGRGETVRLQPLRERLLQLSAPRLQGLDGDAGRTGLSAAETDALDSALQRAALVDTPWSAAFISYLVRVAALDDSEFAYSDAHVRYVSAAFDALEEEQRDGGAAVAYAYRACDIARTTPRPGDLVCFSRAGTAELDDFGLLAEALAERRAGGAWRSFPMHCELVVRTDPAAAGFDAIGGNVVQSVTRRRLELNAESPPTLSARYQPSRRPAACDAGDAHDRPAAACADRFMNLQPWSVLLQYRK